MALSVNLMSRFCSCWVTRYSTSLYPRYENSSVLPRETFIVNIPSESVIVPMAGLSFTTTLAPTNGPLLSDTLPFIV